LSSNYNIFSDDFSVELETEVIVDPTTGAFGGGVTSIDIDAFDTIKDGSGESMLSASGDFTSLGFNVKGGLGIEFTASSNTVTLINPVNIITGSVRNVATYAAGTGQAIQDSNDEFRFNVNSGDSVTLCTVKNGDLRDKHMVLCGGEYGSVVAGGTVYIFGNDDDTSNAPYQGGILLAAGMGTTDNGVIQFRTGVNVSKAIINAEGHLTVSSSKAQVVITGSDEGEVFGVHRNSHPNMLVVSGSVTGSIVRVSGSLEGELFRVGGSGPGLASSAGTANMLVVSSSIASGGRVAIGYTGSSGILDISKDSANTEVVISSYHDTEATTPKITFRKSDGSAAAPALVDDDAVLGTIAFQGYDGSGWEEGARIEARINGTPSDGSDLPTELTFWTTPNASATAAQRMTINNAGNVAIGALIPQGTLHVEKSDGTAAYIHSYNNYSTIDTNRYLGGLVIGATENGTDYGKSLYIAGKATENWTVDSAEGSELTFWTTANTTTTLSQRMVIGQGGNVGIGTASPDTKLHVAGITKISGAQTPSIQEEGSCLFQVTGSDEGMLVGINTSNYPQIFVVSSSARNGGHVAISGSGEGEIFKVKSNWARSILAVSSSFTGSSVRVSGSDEGELFRVGSATSPHMLTVSSSIAGGFGVGVRTASPKYELDLEGHIAGGGYQSTPSYIRFGCDNHVDDISGGILWKSAYASYTKISAKIIGICEGNYARQGLAFYTGNDSDATTDASERLRIDMDGNVGIGTTSPLARLHVSSSVGVGGPYMSPTGSLILASTYNNPTIFRVSGSGVSYFSGSLRTPGETFYDSTALVENQVAVVCTGGIHIQQIETDHNAPMQTPAGVGLRIGSRLSNASNYFFWDIQVEHSESASTNEVDCINFLYKGTSKGVIQSDTDVNQIDFTGQHRSKISDDEENNIESDINSYIGMIVAADGNYTTDLKVDEAIPKVILSTQSNDKKVFGVISNVEDPNSNIRQYTVGSFKSIINKNEDDNRVIINSLGEGAMWVCNQNGNLENGDYITTSDIPGLGQKQNDDLLHNYTVAKITCDCDFDLNSAIYQCEEFEYDGQTYKKAFIGVTYHCG
tara:strand:- start:1126 stop:4380 length:3255 start_codon:yes stop_codon:yes gene_type:complete